MISYARKKASGFRYLPDAAQFRTFRFRPHVMLAGSRSLTLRACSTSGVQIAFSNQTLLFLDYFQFHCGRGRGRGALKGFETKLWIVGSTAAASETHATLLELPEGFICRCRRFIRPHDAFPSLEKPFDLPCRTVTRRKNTIDVKHCSYSNDYQA